MTEGASVAAKVSAAPQNPMTRFSFEVYSLAVLNLKLLVCICFQVVVFSYFAFGPFGRRPLVLCRQKVCKELCVWSFS